MYGQPKILLVEDEDAHAVLIARFIEKADVANEIYRVSDGAEALDFLFHRGKYASKENSPRPDLVLLDLRLPKLDGHEVLTAIKQSEELRDIPVVVLTASENERDVARAYRNYASSYMVKPLSAGKFPELLSVLSSYWLAWTKHPRKVSGT